MDDLVKEKIKAEEERQARTLDLIASENYPSRAVREAMGSILMAKYSEGYPGRRYYAGNEIIDEIELLAQARARKAFRLSVKKWHVNVQPYSGSPANMAVYYALLEPSDKIMGMSLPFGGHLTHGWHVNFSARFYKSVQYAVGRDGYINYDEVRKLARKEKPKVIVTGATAYPRFFDFKKFGAIAREIGAYLMTDIAHVAGLIAAGVHPSPFLYADVVTTTTHKTLRGPRGAIIFANRESPIAKQRGVDIAVQIDRAVFPALQGGPHDNQTAAIAICLEEARQPSFKVYGKQVVKNAKALARELRRNAFELVSGGTDNHMLLVDLTNKHISGKEAQNLLESASIVVNRNAVPYDPRKPFDPSGLRLGTPALTTRGMKEKEMVRVGRWIHELIDLGREPGKVRKEAEALVKKFPLP